MLRKLRPILLDWLIGACCLILPALFNGYPLVVSDTGAYIKSGYTLQLPIDRPIAYSIFVRLCSFDISLWGVVIVQAMMVSGLLLVIAWHFMATSYSTWRFTLLMILTAIATSSAWTTAQVMPDIMTAVMLLACVILACIPLKQLARWGLYLLILGCILMHTSNLLIAALSSIIILLYSLWKKRNQLRNTATALISIAVVGWLSLSTMTAIAGRGFRPSAASHVFLISRMVDDGMMNTFLDEYCPTDSTSYRLCAYRGRLPKRQWDFMWNENSPLYKAGGWQATEKEYTSIIRKSLSTPKFIGLHVRKAASATLHELPMLQVGDGVFNYDGNSSPGIEIGSRFPSDLKPFLTSRQQYAGLGFQFWNVLITVFFLLTCGTALLLGWKRKDNIAFRRATFLSIVIIICNAAVTATFAVVVARYESRVIWIFPFLSTLYILRWLGERKAKADMA
jgi:hypothetical protein